MHYTEEQYEALPYEEKKKYLDYLAKEYGYVQHYPSHYYWLGKSYKQYEGRRPHRMATSAYHMLGDISSNKPDLCYIYGETLEHYVGAWMTGYGMMDVKFPKDSTRKLTPEEAEYWRGQAIQIASQPPFPVKIDDEDIMTQNEANTT